MIITHKLQPMDLASRGVPQRVDVMQDDKYSRNLQISLYENGSKWQIPRDAVAVIRYKKSDGTGGNYDTLPDGTLAYDISGNVLTVALAPQVCTAPGLVDFAVCLIQAESEITTFAVNIIVQPVPGADIASEEYENLTLRFFFVTQAEYDALPEEEKLAGTYFITDQDDDTDTTLTKPGQAADALAVGERFKKVERILPSVTAEDAGKALVVSADGKIVADDKVPFFDLKEMGMADVTSINQMKLVTVDTTHLRIAMGNGQIKIAFSLDGAVIKTVLSCGINAGNGTYASSLILNPQKIGGLDFSPVIVALIAMEGRFYFKLKEIGTESASTTNE